MKHETLILTYFYGIDTESYMEAHADKVKQLTLGNVDGVTTICDTEGSPFDLDLAMESGEFKYISLPICAMTREYVKIKYPKQFIHVVPHRSLPYKAYLDRMLSQGIFSENYIDFVSINWSRLISDVEDDMRGKSLVTFDSEHEVLADAISIIEEHKSVNAN